VVEKQAVSPSYGQLPGIVLWISLGVLATAQVGRGLARAVRFFLSGAGAG
jgi:hypothetical protein